MVRQMIKIILVLVLIFGAVALGFAQGKNDEEIQTTSTINEVQGEVSAINKHGIAIVYKKDLEKGEEYEIYFPIDKNLKIVHKQHLDEIGVGDTVSMQYEEITGEDKGGPKVIDRKAEALTFLRPAEKKPQDVQPTSEVSEEPLSIKGIK